MASARQDSYLQLDGDVQGIYLMDDWVIAVSNLWWDDPAPQSGASADWNEESSVLVTVVDVTDRVNPVILRESYVSGELRTSRRIGNDLYVVTYKDITVDAGADSRSRAKRMVKDADFEAWLPKRMDNVLSGAEWRTDVGRACECTDVWASEKQGGTFVSSVMKLDLADPLSDFQGSAVMGASDTVYASSDAMFLATSEWEDGPFGVDGSLDTVVHRFDLAEDLPEYRASALIQGVLSDRFGMSEREGVLRIATTDQDDWTSGVTTLDADLDELDHEGGLAPGEQIMAARFVGDLGYLVTWEVTLGDPLFTLDLSDPENIIVGGELAVTGWSEYLHPMDEDHLLAVGYDGDWGYLGCGGLDLRRERLREPRPRRPRHPGRLGVRGELGRPRVQLLPLHRQPDDPQLHQRGRPGPRGAARPSRGRAGQPRAGQAAPLVHRGLRLLRQHPSQRGDGRLRLGRVLRWHHRRGDRESRTDRQCRPLRGRRSLRGRVVLVRRRVVGGGLFPCSREAFARSSCSPPTLQTEVQADVSGARPRQ